MQLAEFLEQPNRADGGMPAHGHFVIGHPEAKLEIVIRASRRRQHEAAFMAVSLRDLLHLCIGHARSVDDDGRRIAAIGACAEDADELNIRLTIRRRHVVYPSVGFARAGGARSRTGRANPDNPGCLQFIG